MNTSKFNTAFPVFKTAKQRLEEINTTVSVTSNNILTDAQKKAAYYREKAKNKNTEKSTKNWMIKFEEFRNSSGYLTPLTNLDDVRQIEKEIVEYISGMKKKDDNDYRANSIKQAVDAISRFLLYNSPIRVNLHD
ncbi:6537_t:CDS:1 [Cetraspora pellucida]|uniref:6537_t:CDS:1 n=1 Tax=Cetraspora pellucida TaxID=1433469 RepID=A0ACA9P5F4_9GLOM|nr:6537_t:CDS:1 [Cetraspora pellucida]